MALNKRQKAILAATQPGKAYAIDDALKILKDNSKAKFVEAIDVAVRLGVDAKKSDQQVRGSTVLPAGTGKSVRVTKRNFFSAIVPSVVLKSDRRSADARLRFQVYRGTLLGGMMSAAVCASNSTFSYTSDNANRQPIVVNSATASSSETAEKSQNGVSFCLM